jgi:hypothetical protein
VAQYPDRVRRVRDYVARLSDAARAQVQHWPGSCAARWRRIFSGPRTPQAVQPPPPSRSRRSCAPIPRAGTRCWLRATLWMGRRAASPARTVDRPWRSTPGDGPRWLKRNTGTASGGRQPSGRGESLPPAMPKGVAVPDGNAASVACHVRCILGRSGNAGRRQPAAAPGARTPPRRGPGGPTGGKRKRWACPKRRGPLLGWSSPRFDRQPRPVETSRLTRASHHGAISFRQHAARNAPLHYSARRPHRRAILGASYRFDSSARRA